MPWIAIDDQFPEHDKVMTLTDRAFRIHITSLCYCGRNLTDGLLTAHQVKVICAVVACPRPARYIEELVSAGLWLIAENGDGYEIKNYLEYNPSKARVEGERKKARDRMKRLRSSGERSPELAPNVRQPPPQPHPQGSKEDAPTRDAGPLEGTLTTQMGILRLTAAVGGGPDSQQKIERTLRGYSISEFDLLETERACNGPGVEDKLAVLLSELVKRRKKSERSAA